METRINANNAGTGGAWAVDPDWEVSADSHLAWASRVSSRTCPCREGWAELGSRDACARYGAPEVRGRSGCSLPGLDGAKRAWAALPPGSPTVPVLAAADGSGVFIARVPESGPLEESLREPRPHLNTLARRRWLAPVANCDRLAAGAAVERRQLGRSR
ncbi:hypothetical protein NDU88_000008 [Pleurodeles waltl]|uniref:Uncharacterized protein n=1 Tax=Pleurodeles waltl TaxID=8319 RepID=A0AAV7UQ22_PLEWA|nr:hypothetical protein NDU88_000008 [Pleurodeles waltl]